MMNLLHFSAAKAVFHPLSPEEASAGKPESAVRQYGFYRSLELTEDEADNLEKAVFRLTARNMYRLYINGTIVMHGPARTAAGYARVDEVDVTDFLTDGVNHLAVEILAYKAKSPCNNHYSNDSTLEDAFFIGELEADGKILLATGRDEWKVLRLTERNENGERISHCRECSEVYRLDDGYYLWKFGLADFETAVLYGDEPVYLPHEALLPTLEEHPIKQVVQYGCCRVDTAAVYTPRFYEHAVADYLNALPDRPFRDACLRKNRADRRIKAGRSDDGWTVTIEKGGEEDEAFLLFDARESRVGFLRLTVTAEKAGVVDMIHSEIMLTDGTLSDSYNTVTRLYIPAGTTDFTEMEPGLVRYVKLCFRGTGQVTVHGLSVLEYSYPDEMRAGFQCSDDNINRLYDAAKRTLILNTMDIFMDCPDRERGGWLCDSLWTGRAAALMLADSRVEKEFLENFLLTPAEDMGHAFFPSVYPAYQTPDSFKRFPGISTWSFWLMCELCEYVDRTGDTAMADTFRDRVQAFVNGCHDFIGKSGLLENLPIPFIDWSLSNNPEYTGPVSTPINALFAYMMIALGHTFHEPDWVKEGERVRETLRRALPPADGQAGEGLVSFTDSFTVDDEGHLTSRNRSTESGIATAMWADLFPVGSAHALDRAVRDKMGPAPLYPSNPYIGKSQLFIGLCIRLDMLAKRGFHDRMFADLRAIYEPQLREGPGTLWENQQIDTSSRCHGFNAHAGVLLMRDVLGLGFPQYDGDSKTITIAPHTCGLRWARGVHETKDGLVSVSWQYDGDRFDLTVHLPDSYRCTVVLPKEIRALDPADVHVSVCAGD